MITLEKTIELETRLKDVQKWVADNMVTYSDESQYEWMDLYSQFKDKVGDLVGWYRPIEERCGELEILSSSEAWTMWINWFFKVTGY